GEWMYRTVGGIDTDGAAFKKVILRPQMGEGLSFARTKYDSIRGTIVSDWKVEGGTMTANFIVPPNTTATLYLPAKDASRVTESGKPAEQAAGVKFLFTENGAAVYRLGSGSYQFTVKQ
ncbi:MAG: alpha-L-rhamnosidase C-terminal domain-containing protein, partial [Tepidisphaeraceae bacterium]